MIVIFDDNVTIKALKHFVEKWGDAIVEQHDVNVFEISADRAKEVTRWLVEGHMERLSDVGRRTG